MDFTQTSIGKSLISRDNLYYHYSRNFYLTDH